MSDVHDTGCKIITPLKHRVSHAFCVRDVASKFSERAVFETSEFFSQHDSELVSFKLVLKFGEDSLTVEILSCNDITLAIPMNQITVRDSDGKLLATRRNDERNYLLTDEILTCRVLYEARNVELGENWRIFYELEYEKYHENAIQNESFGSNLQIHSDYLKLFESSHNADVTFLIQNERIKAHKLILSTRSKYFERMFDLPLQESEANEIIVPDIKPTVFKAMLEHLYSGLPPRNLADVSLELLTVADKYGMEELATISETSVLENLGAHNVVDSLLIAEMLNNETLLARSKEVFRECRDLVKQSEEDVEKLKTKPSLIIDLLFDFPE